MNDVSTIAREAIGEAATRPRQKREASPTTRKLFVVLHGNYGSLFLSKYATGEKSAAGGDKGVAAAMLVWDAALSKFAPDVVEAAAKRLISEHPEFAPNLPQVQGACEAITPRKTYAQENNLPRLAAPEPAAPVELADFKPRGDMKDWARRIMARHDAGDKIGMFALASARTALGLGGLKAWQ